VSAGVLQLSYAPAPGIGEEHQEWSYSTAGSQLTRKLVCDTDPNGAVGASEVDGYTATATQVTLFIPSNAAAGFNAENVTFTLQ
jgi:hypothetical protein